VAVGARNMAYETNHDGQQRIMNHLADSVLQLSDEEILAEVRESGTDPQEEAERTSVVLRQAADTWQFENERLSNLGHTINPNNWRCIDDIYHNYCLSCGSPVSFTTATQRMEGDALNGSCPKTSTSRKGSVR
jgi:hypothetical protein